MPHNGMPFSFPAPFAFFQSTLECPPKPQTNRTMWQQTSITLRPRSQVFHLITDEILAALPELKHCKTGLLHLLLQHTSASLTLNENADPAVRRDFERFFARLVPNTAQDYEHLYEGPDDLPAHFKASLLGCQLSLPIQRGQLALGTWQGIYLGEHRTQAGPRRLLATIHGIQ